MSHDFFTAAVEFKAIEHAGPGTFTGYGAVFGNRDGHGDVIAPGAFDANLAAHKARGTMPGMYAEHSRYIPGGDLLPIGIWTKIEPDARGLRVEGKLIPIATNHIRRIYYLLKDGALGGLSIAYHVPDGGAVYGRKSGEPKRLLRAVELHSIDIVRAPSNPSARIDGVKALMVHADKQAACDAIVAAARLHQRSTAGGNSPSAEERALLMEHLHAGHKALTGEMIPPQSKFFRQSVSELRAVLARFSLPPSPAGCSAQVEAVTALRGVLADFTLRPPR